MARVFLLGATALSVDLAPRLAARLRTGLSAHCIDTVQSLPGVGRNLQDHVSTIVMYLRRDTSPFFRNMRADHVFGTGVL